MSKFELCDWCDKPAGPDGLSAMWEDHVCEFCIQEFGETMGPTETLVPPSVSSPTNHHPTNPDPTTPVHQVRCFRCNTPGPGADSESEAIRLARFEGFVMEDLGPLCPICHTKLSSEYDSALDSLAEHQFNTLPEEMP